MKKSDIDYSKKEVITFDATVIQVLMDGNAERKAPIKAILKLEEDGELLEVVSWNHDLLEQLKSAVKDDIVYEFSGQVGTYDKYGGQIRVGSMSALNIRSTKKILKTVDIEKIKKDISNIVDTYIPKSSTYRQLVEKLIINNERFWMWPAATRIHHNYTGGLAKHTLSVCQLAIDTAKHYEGSNCSLEAVVAGALLHDIGKINEYQAGGERTRYGNLIPHIPDGHKRLILAATELGINIDDVKFVVLENIILSHHEKLEFGSPTGPGTMEAFIVARADALDAAFESGDVVLDVTEKNQFTGNISGMDGIRLLKW